MKWAQWIEITKRESLSYAFTCKQLNCVVPYFASGIDGASFKEESTMQRSAIIDSSLTLGYF